MLNEFHIVPTFRSLQDGEDKPMYTELIITQQDEYYRY